MLLRETKQFVGDIIQKQENIVSKNVSLLINLLFIELL